MHFGKTFIRNSLAFNKFFAMKESKDDFNLKQSFIIINIFSSIQYDNIWSMPVTLPILVKHS